MRALKRTRVLPVLSVTIAALTLIACQASLPPAETPVRPADTSLPAIDRAEGVPTSERQEGDRATAGPEVQKHASAARADLALQLGIPEENIRVMAVEAVDWPDASLGCPQPGTMYAQIITPGYRIVLAAEGATYTYHTDGGKLVVLCDAFPQPGKSGQKGEPAVQDGWPWQSRGDEEVIAPPAGRKP